ncbi:MAG: hypothetical protein UHS41_03075 [Lachnospiraceae bacterium]|nr:hypothetical protein [Lachnospiraceae bacterium]
MKWEDMVFEYLPKKFIDQREKRIRGYTFGTESYIQEKIKQQIGTEVKVAVLLISLLVISIAGTVIYSLTQENTIKIERNAAGGGESSEQLEIISDGKEYEYQLPVSEELYTEKEKKQAFQDAFSYLEEQMLAKNHSLEEVRSDLVFMWEVPGSPMEVQWEFEDEDLIDMEGKVWNEDLTRGSKITHVKAILTYQNTTEEKVYTIIVCPRKLTKTQKAAEAAWKKIKELEKNSRTSKWIEIPTSILNVQVSGGKQRNPWMIAAVMIIILFPIFIARQWESEKKQLEEIKNESELEYSNILWQFILLLEAGLTISSAWKKIVMDYEKKKNQMKTARCYVYEQMAYVYHRMELGESQERAFGVFSKRMSMKSYSKLMTLFLQNLTKGSKNMLDILKSEEQEAFINRCEQAKRMGEEADTKLLLPMGVMLLNILILLMIPAFLQF